MLINERTNNIILFFWTLAIYHTHIALYSLKAINLVAKFINQNAQFFVSTSA